MSAVTSPSDPNEERQRWIQTVRSFCDEVTQWSSAQGWLVVPEEMKLTEELLGTYTVRLFAEFEALLRAQYPHSRPGRSLPNKSDGLIAGLGSRYRIPAAERNWVHKGRAFRHSG